MRVLCVAEKPSIAKSISQILSGGQLTTHNTQTNYIKNYEFDYPQTRSFFTVTCVSGHLTAIDFYDTHRRWNTCDSFDLFDAPVDIQVAPDKKAIEQNLLTQARRADMLMIWTDCDREGEHIGMEVAKVCRKAKPTIRIKRARFSAIIPQQIHNAAQHPVELDKRQADAVEARFILDLKVGAAFTRLQTLALQSRVQQISQGGSVVSYGPCQFPTLGFVVQRYNYVKVFRPESFWYIYLSLTRQTTSQGEEETKFNWKRHQCFDRFAATNIFSLMMESTLARVTKVTSSNTKKWKPLPLTTVELQKAGSRLLRLAPKKVLDIAEKLYQQGFVSYPRTETDQFDPQFGFMTLIEKQTVDPAWGAFATSLQQGGFGVPRRGKNDDKAHPPIHPTAHAGNLEGDEKRVYEYITRRFLACCSKDAQGWQTTVDVVYGGEDFSATGLIVREKNYLNVYIYDKWIGHHIPDFEEGEEFEPTVCELREGQTSKPNYLTEADLVTLMDKNGIGTDATIAQHIQTIIDRDYVIERMEGGVKYLVPSTLGTGLIEGYNRIGLAKNVSKPQLRRETERRMVQVCEGTSTKNDMLVRSLDQYKDMYIIVRREFEKVTSSVVQHLAGQGAAQNGPAGDGGGGGDEGGGTGGGRGGRGGGRGGRGGGRGGRGRNGDNDQGRKGRGGGCGRATSQGSRAPAANPISVSDSEDDPKGALAYRKPLSHQSGPSSSAKGTLVGSSYSVRPGLSASSSRSITSSRKAGPSECSSTTPKPTPSRTTSTKNTSPEDVHCNCDLPAVLKTVVRETASKGREFWSCSSRDGCGFFSWADEGPVASGSRTSMTSVPAKRPCSTTQGAVSDSAVRMCKCNEEGILQTVLKETANKGRKFWVCRQSEPTRCAFFEWDDEPSRTTSSQGGATSRSQCLNISNGPGSGATSGECFRCNQEGHWARECPNEGNNSNKRPKSFGSSTNDIITAICYKCQQPGHSSSACPNGAKGPRSRPTYSENHTKTGIECFKCGESGHWSTKCPQAGGSSKSKSSFSGSGTGKRGRDGGTAKAKRGGGGKKKSAYAAADGY